MKMVSKDSALRAQEITIKTTDELIIKELHILIAPTSLDGSTEMEIRHMVKPAEDEELLEAQHFFANNGFPEDLSVVVTLFTDALFERETVSIDALIEKYTTIGQKDGIKNIISMIRAKAAAVEFNNTINGANPEMVLPDESELKEYQKLLRSFIN